MQRMFLAGIWLVICLALALPGSAGAQQAISALSASYEFGRQIHFQASLQSDEPIEYALLYYQEKTSPNSFFEPVQFSIQDGNTYLLDCRLDLSLHPIRAFSTLQYFFEVRLQSGQSLTSARQSLVYIDDRFAWQTVTSGPFTLHWVEGNAAFGQQTLEIAQTGLERIETILPVERPKQIDIYAYPNSAAMQETLLIAGQNWIAGHADPDLGVIVVTLPPGPDQKILTEQRLPHELMHILLYEASGPGYNSLPTWLNEGLASFAELFPNPDYQSILNNANQNNTLQPISSLCSGFPGEASAALRAYAQSASFINYLHATYGADGLKAMLDQYASGVGCEHGAQSALGISLAQLERQWRAERLGENLLLSSLQKILPWLVILAAVMLPPLALLIGMRRQRATRHLAKLFRSRTRGG
jgi:hypothetical protein